MKKSLIILPFLSLLVGCGGDSIYEKYADYNMLSSNLEISYEEGKVIYRSETGMDISGAEFHSKAKPSEVIETLIPGDKLEIFYDDNQVIKDVIVEKSDYVVARARGGFNPGVTEFIASKMSYNLLDEEYEGHFVHGRKVPYIIEPGGTYRTFDDPPIFDDDFYVVFNPKDSSKNYIGNPIHELIAVYSFKPR